MNIPTKKLLAAMGLAAMLSYCLPLVADDAAPTPTPAVSAPTDAPKAAVSEAQPAPAAVTPQTATPPTAVPQASAPQAVAPTAAPAADAPLHEVNPPASPDAPQADDDQDTHGHGHHRHRVTRSGDDMVAVMGPCEVLANEHCTSDAVAVMGRLEVDGTVDGDAVAVLGSNTINGTVHGTAVSVLGGLKLGPKAHVDGDLVCIMGHLDRDPASYVGGQVVHQGGFLSPSSHPAMSSWAEHFSHGQLLSFGPHLAFIWFFVFIAAVFYALLALVFPAGVTRCADTIVHRPGATVLVGFLSILALPIFFVLLLVTVVGIPVAFIVLPLCILAAITFGKAGIFALVGRAVPGAGSHPVASVLVGMMIFTLLYLVPVVGILLWLFVGWVGYACAVTALFPNRKKPTPPPAATPGAPTVPPVAAPAAPSSGTGPTILPLAAAVPPVMVEQPAGASTAPAPVADPAAAPVTPETAPAAAQVPPPLMAPAAAVPVAPPVVTVPAASEAELPKAGFWIRMVALLMDGVLIGVIIAFLSHSGSMFLPALAVYGAVLWKLRGATLADIILGMKVVRQDGRPFDWTTSIVRVLGCFFSLLFAGIGFIWIAFDPEKKAWHDKIAGTVVVRLPKGVSLV